MRWKQRAPVARMMGAAESPADEMHQHMIAVKTSRNCSNLA